MARWTRFFRRSPITTGDPAPAGGRWPLVVGVVLGIWLSLALYADTLTLPYLQEDVTHLQWLADRGPIDPFFDAQGAPAYRPLGKAIIKSWYLLLGRHDRAWLRFHNIAFNALNVALVGLLGAWLDRSRHRYAVGGLAALLFGAFPFAYQAIPWINNFFYPLSLLLLLLLTAVYWQARVRRSTRLLALALFLVLLAPFEIEYGVMGSGLLLAVEVALWQQERQPRPWLGGPALGLLMNVAFVARWFTIPKQAYSFGLPTPERIVQIGTYFLQGLVYPIAPLATPLMENTGLSDLAAVALVGVPALALLLGFLVWQRRWALLALGLLWFGLLNAPALLFVSFDYVLNGPRLLYPPGPAVVWLWAAAIVWIVPGRGRAWRAALAAAVVVAVLGVSGTFVRRLVGHYHVGAPATLQLAEVARQTPDDEQLLVVNFPSWITPHARTFALGNHGAQFVPFYIGLDAVIYGHTETAQAVQAVQFANVRREQPYFYGMLGERVDYDGLRARLLESGPVYLTQWGPQATELVYAGRATDVSFPAPEAVYGDAVAVALAESDVGADGVRVTLRWQLQRAIPEEWTVFVHLYGPDGTLVSQADGYPLRGLAPFWLWDGGQVLADTRWLPWPENAPAGTYRVGVGVYDPAGNARITATRPGGTPLPDDIAILLTVERP